jgi:transposase-like protein
MGEYSEAFVAFDVAKIKHAVAVAEGGRTGEVRFLGRREVLGLAIGASEAETFWTEFLRKLARRGLRGVNSPLTKSGFIDSV